MHLARSWPKLILFWCKMDKIMNIAYGYPESLNNRFHITSAIYFALALGKKYSLLYNTGCHNELPQILEVKINTI